MATVSPLRRIVPSLMALSVMGALVAADPTVSVSGGATGSSSSVTFTVDWTDDIQGWDPTAALSSTYAAGATTLSATNGDFRAYVRNSQTSSVTAVSASDANGTDVGWSIIPIVQADIVSATSHSVTFTINIATKDAALGVPVTGVDQLWIQVPTASAFTTGGSPAAVTVTTLSSPTLVYSKLSGTAAQYAGFTQPSSSTNYTAYLTKRPTLTMSINVDDNEDIDPIDLSTLDYINKQVLASMNWTAMVWEDADADTTYDAGEEVGQVTFNKKADLTKYATTVDSTLGRQLKDIPLTKDLTYGSHTLRLRILDPAGTVVTPTTSSNTTPKLVIWERPTLAVNGVPVAPGGTIKIDRTNNILFTGSKFNLTGGSEDSTVTLTVDGTAVTIDTNGTNADTQFSATLSTLAAGTSHAVVLTQTSAATGTPSLQTSFTIDNSTIQDVTAPDLPIVSSPSNGATVDSNKPTITGQAEANSTITMQAVSSDGGTTRTHTGTITADASGNFTLGTAAWSGALTAGKTYNIQVKATDAAGNISEWSDDTIVTVPSEVVVPVIALATTPVTVGGVLYSKVTGATLPLTVTFNKLDGTAYGAGDAWSGLAAADFTVVGGTVAVGGANGSNTTLTLTPTATTTTSFSIALPADKFSIGSASNNAAVTYTFVRDITLPTVTAALKAGVGGSTTSVGTNVQVVLTASEPIYTVDTAQALTFTNTTGTPTMGTPTYTISTDLKTVTLTYASASYSSGTPGSLALTSVPVNLLKDIAGNGNAVTTITGQSKTIDTVAPTVDSTAGITSTAAAIGKVSPIPFVFKFAESVVDFDSTKIKITNGVLASITGSGTTYTVSVTPGEGPTPVKVEFESGATVTDTTGKVSASLSGSTSGTHYLSRIYDSTTPRIVSLTSSTPAPTSSDDKPTASTAIPCSIVFSEALSAAPKVADFAVENGTISNITGSGSAYTFTLNVSAPTTTTKKVRVVYLAGKAQDSAVNLNSSVAVLVRNFDGVAPTIANSSSSAFDGTNTTAELTATYYLNITGTDVLQNRVDISKLNPSAGVVESVTLYDAVDGGGSAITTVATTPVRSLKVKVINIPRIPGQILSLQYGTAFVKDKAGNSSAAGQVDLTVAATN